MNLPNRLTILRIALIPLCLVFLVVGWHWPAAIVFAIACFTDYLDGYLARKHKLVTNFGKFMDPVADKVLVLSVMVTLLFQGRFPLWAVVIVLARELTVDGLRLVAAERGIVIAASNLAKVKTVMQMAAVFSATIALPWVITVILCVVMALLTVVSGYQYFQGVKDILNPSRQ